MDDRDAGIVRRSICRCDGEQARAVFVGGQEAAVQPVDVSHKLLREQDAQAERAAVGIEYIDASLCAGAGGCGG